MLFLHTRYDTVIDMCSPMPAAKGGESRNEEQEPVSGQPGWGIDPKHYKLNKYISSNKTTLFQCGLCAIVWFDMCCLC